MIFLKRINIYQQLCLRKNMNIVDLFLRFNLSVFDLQQKSIVVVNIYINYYYLFVIVVYYVIVGD